MREASELPTDIRLHYREVRKRLWARPAKAPRDILDVSSPGFRLRYAAPIGPDKPLFAHVKWPSRKTTPAAAIVREVLLGSPFTVECIVGESRQKDVVKLRQKAMWRFSKELGWSLTQIGNFFNRDHTTVLHSVRKLDGLPRKGSKS